MGCLLILGHELVVAVLFMRKLLLLGVLRVNLIRSVEEILILDACQLQLLEKEFDLIGGRINHSHVVFTLWKKRGVRGSFQ